LQEKKRQINIDVALKTGFMKFYDKQEQIIVATLIIFDAKRY
jgi:hypothetical protein